MPLQLTTYYRAAEIPELPGSDLFHSKTLFQTYEATPGYMPFLIVAFEEQKTVAKLLAVTRSAQRFFFPSLLKQCEIYGTGDYLKDGLDQEQLFGEMLEHLTNEMQRHAFLIEFRNLESTTFGYKHFRQNGYFPIPWLRVRNSLHSSKSAEDRFTPSRIRQIKKGIRNGATVQEAKTPEEVSTFSHMLRRAYASHLRHHFPHIEFFRQITLRLMPDQLAKIFIVKHKNRVIGGASCLYSNGTAYLWFSGGMRKRFAAQNPGILAVWAALKDAYKQGYDHLEFMDVGLPFQRYGYREFVLQFGGKQQSTRRWFRFRWTWINRLIARISV